MGAGFSAGAGRSLRRTRCGCAQGPVPAERGGRGAWEEAEVSLKFHFRGCFNWKEFSVSLKVLFIFKFNFEFIIYFYFIFIFSLFSFLILIFNFYLI